MSYPIDKLNVFRAAVIMAADAMLSDLRSIREAKSVEEAKAPVNGLIDRVNALTEAAYAATEANDEQRLA